MIWKEVIIDKKNNTAMVGDSKQDSKTVAHHVEGEKLNNIGEFQDTAGQKLQDIKTKVAVVLELVNSILAGPVSEKGKLHLEGGKKILENFGSGFEDVLKDPRENLDELIKSRYEKSPMGRLEKFVQALLVEKVVEPIGVLKEKEFLTALKKFINSACNVVIVICKGVLENTKASGECAKSFQELLVAGKKVMMSGKKHTGAGPVR
ncbi:hypothetical protein [Candidatus Tisiphia endosymbiont of Beris chalybata]|uniref:hypothetical protein n=1 Tax=Candidatus Tisiphia endosymbiont of Beris chalybata TaxID=3066262 RepID=UPI00312CA01E